MQFDGGDPQQRGLATNADMSSINVVQAVAQSLNYNVDESKRKQLVCIHWIKNRCTRGDDCDYLHVYIEEKVPVCRYQQQTGACHREAECVYRHPKPEDGGIGISKKQEVCPYYERGFCKAGLECPFLHDMQEKRICLNFALGFCPLGPECQDVHVKNLLSPRDLQLMVLANFPQEENWSDSQALAAG